MSQAGKYKMFAALGYRASAPEPAASVHAHQMPFRASETIGLNCPGVPMSKPSRYIFIAIFLITSVIAYSSPTSQPTVWGNKPDAAAFEKIVNDRLAEGQKSIDKMLAVKSSRPINN